MSFVMIPPNQGVEEGQNMGRPFLVKALEVESLMSITYGSEAGRWMCKGEVTCESLTPVA
jgi:hypothetical protein